MICKKCKDPIEFGEACIVEPSETSRHNNFFHTGCHAAWKGERVEEKIL